MTKPSPSLLDDWRLFMSNIKSPLSFIDMSFYSMIAGALQRKCWMQNTKFPLFCNMYIFLVGPAGTGKGLTLTQVNNFVRFHKLFDKKEKDLREAIAKEVSSNDKNEKKMAILAEVQAQLKADKESKGDKVEEPLLIPVTADATTYEKLTSTHSRAKSTIKVEPCAFAPNGVYIHSSLTAILPEISSLFQKNAEKLVEYLLAAFDCAESYSYETIKRGVDRVRCGYLNMLGGTTVSFLQESFREKLLRDGFSSRSIFVYEAKSRFEKWEIDPPTEAQLQAEKRILDHIYELANLFGEISFEPNAVLYLKNQIEIIWPNERLNPSPALDDYYARKDIHVKKLAAAIHFSKTPIDMWITEEDAREAVALLERLEKNMHKALDFEGKNPLSLVQKQIIKYLFRVKDATYGEIYFQFEKDISNEQLKNLLMEMQEMGFVKPYTREGETKQRYKPIKEVGV